MPLILYKMKRTIFTLSVILVTLSMSIAQSGYWLNQPPIAGTGNAGFGLNSLAGSAASAPATYNTATGEDALRNLGSAVPGTAAGHYNTATGYRALYTTVGSSSNTAVGYKSMFSTTTGDRNSALGLFSLYSNTSGVRNCAFGMESLYTNTSGSSNSSFGWFSLYYNTTGASNCAVGALSGRDNTTGSSNCAFGTESLLKNTTGNNSTAVGCFALLEATAEHNTAVGTDCLHYVTTGTDNSAIGMDAGRNTTTGGENTIAGTGAMYNNTTGSENTAVGFEALNGNTTGTDNTAVGHGALQINTTGVRNTALGYNATMNANNLQDATAIGQAAVCNNSGRVWIGSPTLANGVWCAAGAWNTPSDERFKFNVRNDVKGLEFIMKLRPVLYNWDTRKFTEHITQLMPEDKRNFYLSTDFVPSMTANKIGFLAQEVEQAAKESGFNFAGIHVPNSITDTYGLDYSSFVVPLVKSVQEQQAVIERLESKIAEQDAALAALKSATKLPDLQYTGSIFQNEPNPFHEETVIKYSLPHGNHGALLIVYDLSGKQLFSLPLSEGSSEYKLVAAGKLTAGIYLYSIVVDGKVADTKRMTVLD
jgi:trimeric autotransporter adhesin